MRLDRECVRDLLLAIESETFGNDITKHSITNIEQLKRYGINELTYTMLKLEEAKYINVDVQYAGDDVYNFHISSLTWNGHLFLDNIRDEGVWKSTKKVASKFSSVSLSMLSSIATSVISKMISAELGN